MKFGVLAMAAAMVLGVLAPAVADNYRGDRNDDRSWGARSSDDRFDRHGPPPGDRWRDDRRGGGWMTIDRLSFEGSNDIENAFTGWRGRHVDRMALRADTTARCNRVIANFRDGRSFILAKNQKLERGETVVFDFPRDARDLDTIYLRCHAFGNGRVMIEVMGQR